MTSLYQLSSEYQRLLTKEEYDDADLQALDALHTTIEDRAIHYAYLIKELEGKLSATEEAIKIASEKKARLKRNIDRITSYVLETLSFAKINIIDKDPLFDIRVKQNPVSVDDYDRQQIPNDYWVKKEEFSLDKKRIKEDIENLGLVIPGVRLTRKIVLKIE